MKILDDRMYLVSMRACALRWRLRSRQVKEGKEWARLEADESLKSAVWYKNHLTN